MTNAAGQKAKNHIRDQFIDEHPANIEEGTLKSSTTLDTANFSVIESCKSALHRELGEALKLKEAQRKVYIY